MIQNYLTGNMDSVYDPTSEGHPLRNGEGSDDKLFLPVFDNWLKNEVKGSFFASMFLFNTHFPYNAPSTKNSTASQPYYAGLESFDNTLKTVFSILEKNGQLNNTIIIVTGDHGEYMSTDGKLYARLNSYNPYILQPLTFMHIPQALFPSNEAREKLKRNQEKVLSTLDLFPTMQHILYGGDVESTAQKRASATAAHVRQDDDHCVTGFDLMGDDIHDDRLAVSWNVASEQQPRGRLIAISDKHNGVYRKGAFRYGTHHMQYTECIEKGEGACCERMTLEDVELRAKWKQTVQDLRSTEAKRGLSKQLVERTQFLDYFLEDL